MRAAGSGDTEDRCPGAFDEWAAEFQEHKEINDVVVGAPDTGRAGWLLPLLEDSSSHPTTK